MILSMLFPLFFLAEVANDEAMENWHNYIKKTKVKPVICISKNENCEKILNILFIIKDFFFLHTISTTIFIAGCRWASLRFSWCGKSAIFPVYFPSFCFIIFSFFFFIVWKDCNMDNGNDNVNFTHFHLFFFFLYQFSV